MNKNEKINLCLYITYGGIGMIYEDDIICKWRENMDWWGATVYMCSKDGTECLGCDDNE